MMFMNFRTFNPIMGELIAEYETLTRDEVFSIADCCSTAFRSWSKVDITERIGYMKKLADILKENKDTFARLITLEMGKPIKEAFAEVEKCAWMANVYASHSESWLSEENVKADGKSNHVIFQPLGVILSIMPWNFPFWQVLRFAVPTLIAGNCSILKHSNTVPQCALAIEFAFARAGLPDNVFRSIIADHNTIADLIASNYIQGVSFTGSTEVGSKIAELAGRNIKKVVLELGGSDPFIVLDDADIEFAAKNAVLGRNINTGQSCIAAKRFIVRKEVAEVFSVRFADLMSQQVVGDPRDENTDIGPLVNQETLNKLETQVNDAVNKGAKVLTGGKRLNIKGFYFPPTVLSNVKADMKVMTEEVFGPVAPIITVNSDEEAIKVANATPFGLGGSVWTKNLERGEQLARELEAGTVFVNNITKSDPRMPFGGTKKSGLGRELAKYGLKEFVNIKGLNIYEHEEH